VARRGLGWGGVLNRGLLRHDSGTGQNVDGNTIGITYEVYGIKLE
jgi:hypothetical protein